jgi:hypothetical protein
LAVRLETDLTARRLSSPLDWNGREGTTWERAGVGELTGGDGERRPGCRTTSELLLGRPVQTVAREVVGNGGAARGLELAGVRLGTEPVGEELKEDV